MKKDRNLLNYFEKMTGIVSAKINLGFNSLHD